jgi:hypothetical protein
MPTGNNDLAPGSEANVPLSKGEPARSISAEQLVAGDNSTFPPVGESVVTPPASKPTGPATNPAPTVTPGSTRLSANGKKIGRPIGAKDVVPRKLSDVPNRPVTTNRPLQVRDAKGHIIGNVARAPGTVLLPDKSRLAPDFSDMPEPEPLPGEPSAPSFDCRATAEVSFDTGAGIMTMIFGGEWQPKTTEEREQVVAALTRYFEVKNIRDIPPGAALTLVLLTYSAVRLKEPKTASKLKLGWTWAKTRWQNFLARRRGHIPVIRAVPPVERKEHETGESKSGS